MTRNGALRVRYIKVFITAAQGTHPLNNFPLCCERQLAEYMYKAAKQSHLNTLSLSEKLNIFTLRLSPKDHMTLVASWDGNFHCTQVPIQPEGARVPRATVPLVAHQ